MVCRPLLLAFALLPLDAQVLIEPRHCVLQAGRTQAFTARSPEGFPVACAWTVTGPAGAIGADGVFRGGPGLHRVRAASLKDPAVFDETGVLVLEDIPGLRTVGEVRPEALAPGWSEALPFVDITTGRRLGDPGDRVLRLQGAAFPQRDIIGYGLPVTVTWPAPGLVPDAQLLSWREGHEPVRRDVTGSHGAVMQARGPITGAQVEFLNRGTGRDWTSLVQPLAITVRGLLPFAGNPLGPGDADGTGLSARFRSPEGLARMADGTLVAADSQARAVRLVSPEGAVTTIQGTPFVSPAFVAVRGAAILVADAGGHVIRRVDRNGTVTTLAGVPGLRGHRDSAEPGEALFDGPQGLALDPEGNLFVADRGNHVIRKVTAQGAVTTVAGIPGAAGSQDGPQGTFSALMGLAWRAPGTLYAVDGHSVRSVVNGAVTTLCGDPARPGPSRQTRAGVPVDGRTPCLDHPHSIALLGRDLVVTDTGNRTVQAILPCSNGRVDLSLLAGDTSLAGTRFGLLRMGIEGPLGEEFAALTGPRGLVTDGMGDLFVADGTCLVHLSAAAVTLRRTAPAILLFPRGTVHKDLPLTVDFAGPGRNPEGQARCFWTLDALDPEGRPVLPRVRGVLSGGRGGRAELTFRKPGQVKLRLTCITEDGVPLQDTAVVTVE
ncbi:MAG: hypothetical protein HGA66_07925 [Holophaga sp.]|nr:hypothetical protein [Holophaga sp.]